MSVLVEKKQVLEDAETIAVLGKCGNVPVYTAEFEVLTKLTGFKLTRGMLCAMKRRRLPGLQEICNGCDRIAVLENVMNPTNVGAIFRSAAALHMDAVILTGGCSNPLYRRASRVSMGTVFQIPWTFVDNSVIWPEEGMKILRELGFKMAAMALKEDSAGSDTGNRRRRTGAGDNCRLRLYGNDSNVAWCRFAECRGRQCSSILAVGKEINRTDKTLDMLQLKNCL